MYKGKRLNQLIKQISGSRLKRAFDGRGGNEESRTEGWLLGGVDCWAREEGNSWTFVVGKLTSGAD